MELEVGDSDLSSCQESDKYPRGRHRDAIEFFEVEQDACIDQVDQCRGFDVLYPGLGRDNVLDFSSSPSEDIEEPSDYEHECEDQVSQT